jgi:hypothetical protein
LSYLEELPDDSVDLADAVDAIAEVAVSAFIWRSLLKLGARDAPKYAPVLRELLAAQPVLSHAETAPEAAAFLSLAARLLSATELEEVEAAIVEVARGEDPPARHWAKRLIAQFPDDRVTTEAARELKAEALEDGEARSNRPLVSFSTFSERYAPEDWLRDEGVEPDEPLHRRLLSATDALQNFASQFLNQDTLPGDDVDAAIHALEEVLALLEEHRGLPNALSDMAWARVGDAAAVAARFPALTESDVQVLRRTLVACAAGEAPRPTENAEESFNFPAWSPAARNAAAQGIPRLVERHATPDLLGALSNLAVDHAPSVRYLLAAELPRLVPGQEETFWQIAELYVERETNTVVQQAIGRALMAVGTPEREDRVTEALDQLFRRVPLHDIARTVAHEDHIGALVAGLAVARENRWATSALDETVRTAPASYLPTLVLHLMHYVDYQRLADPSRRLTAEAALTWLPPILDRVDVSLREEIERLEAGDAERGGHIRELFEVVDQVISRFYFESGIYQGRAGSTATQDEICTFFAAIQPLVRRVGEMAGGLSGLGLPARTAHHFIELLRGSLSCDPAEVLHLTRLVVEGARGAGYAFDPMAAREVTAIIETTLADHREIARTGEPLQDLMRVLDVFVEAGWPEAQQLVWRLEELFR